MKNKKVAKSIFLFSLFFCLLTTRCSIFCEDSAESPDYGNLSVENLINLLLVKESEDFMYITEELGKRCEDAKETAPYLAKAILYPRRDSFLAGYALIAMRAEGRTAIPQLLVNLSSPREDVRKISLFALGAIGLEAKCAVPRIAMLLWDDDPYVRTTAAGALEEILEVDFDVMYPIGLDFDNPQVSFPDEPEGYYSLPARTWWEEEGSLLDWGTQLDYCSDTQ